MLLKTPRPQEEKEEERDEEREELELKEEEKNEDYCHNTRVPHKKNQSDRHSQSYRNFQYYNIEEEEEKDVT